MGIRTREDLRRRREPTVAREVEDLRRAAMGRARIVAECRAAGRVDERQAIEHIPGLGVDDLAVHFLIVRFDKEVPREAIGSLGGEYRERGPLARGELGGPAHIVTLRGRYRTRRDAGVLA